ncbi:hypothetical protein JCM5296_002150 [Sporobolomyces johnsonii]
MSRHTHENLPHTDRDPYGWESGQGSADRTPRQKNTESIGRPTERKEFVSAADVYQGAVTAVASVDLRTLPRGATPNIALGGRSPISSASVAALVYWTRSYRQHGRPLAASAPLFNTKFPTTDLPIELHIEEGLAKEVLQAMERGHGVDKVSIQREGGDSVYKATFFGPESDKHGRNTELIGYRLDIRPVPRRRGADEFRRGIVAPTETPLRHTADGSSHGITPNCVTIPFLFLDTLQQLADRHGRGQPKHDLLFILRIIVALHRHASSSGPSEWSVSPDALRHLVRENVFSLQDVDALIDWASDHLDADLARDAAAWEDLDSTQASGNTAALSQDVLEASYRFAFDRCQHFLKVAFEPSHELESASVPPPLPTPFLPVPRTPTERLRNVFRPRKK